MGHQPIQQVHFFLVRINYSIAVHCKRRKVPLQNRDFF